MFRDTKVPTVAHAVCMMALSIAVPDTIASCMRAATASQTLVGAIKSLWLGCPAGQQVLLLANLRRQIKAAK